MKLKKKEFFLLSLLLLVCVGVGLWFYWPRTGHTTAIITVDSKEFRRIDLQNAPDQTFSIVKETGKPVSFEILDGKIRFIEVTCPDHICEQAGWCEKPGDRAVCMPNRTTLICYADEELED